MTSTRTLTVLAIAAAAAASLWLWQSGQWRQLANRVPALAEALGAAANPAPAVSPADAAPVAGDGITPPDHLVSWRDGDGVLHFSSAATAPPGARQYTPGKAGTLADYEKALESNTGVTAEHLYRAQQARLARERELEQGGTAAASPAATNQDPSQIASSQARELLRQRDAALEQIRNENAR